MAGSVPDGPGARHRLTAPRLRHIASPILPQLQDSGFLRITAPNAEAQTVLAPHKAAVEVFKKKEVAHVPDILCSRRVPGGEGSADYGRSGPVCNAQGDVNIHGGGIQQLVAQSYLEVVNANYGGADFTLQSGGGVRVPMEGMVTAEDVITVLPFGNMLWRMNITGAEARAMIEDGLDATFRQGGSNIGVLDADVLQTYIDTCSPRI